MPCSKLFIVGMPLNEGAPVSQAGIEALQSSDFLIGESRKQTFPMLKRSQIDFENKKVFLLDPAREENLKEIYEFLKDNVGKGIQGSLFSDCGMPILFDPGLEILQFCRKLDFRIEAVPAETSWASAAAISGLKPPFHVEGFLPTKSPLRIKRLEILKKKSESIVLMDTPYRFRTLLKECTQVFGKPQSAFLAWNIGYPNEDTYLWGTLGELEKETERKGLQKGEFVLILLKH